MALHLVTAVTDIPPGERYRIIGADCPWWGEGVKLIETEKEIDGLEAAPDKFPNGVENDTKGCLAEWVVAGEEPDPVKDQADNLIAQLDALSTQYPEKVAVAMDESIAITAIRVKPLPVKVPVEKIGV
jgi:hypothetical protein